ncbi:PREDICTED: uncharacterized protein LOC109162647 [Ipomoea nil]|uniref:uncharacterized protein LOC109162647 n=1 Tax=Ipomoea nil TaxID=35883 RepID=UPI000900EFB1|nr:PREDICTED: uncharacterized protein LOC109162647 [Ipomoea nil]
MGTFEVDTLSPRVTRAQNHDLLRPFEPAEVKHALFAMGKDKSPGPDGMNPEFYQSLWDLIGKEFTDFVLACLSQSSFPPELNDANIVLIPKKAAPELVTDLRPIALCNVVYKVMAKMIDNRMKPLLDGIVSESHSAFLPSRLISDNILIASEVGHYLRRKQLGQVGWAALKLDKAKAYDRMEWRFVERMLLGLGFDAKRDAQAKGQIHGCRVARGAPPISHLFFADDSLLFFKANMQETMEVKRCLEVYEQYSGQSVNFHKSNISFSRNTALLDRDAIAMGLGVEQAEDFGKYLGLPSVVGRNMKFFFSYVEKKRRQRFGSWNKRLLSMAGKEIDEQILVGKEYHSGWDTLDGLGKDARYYRDTTFYEASLGGNPSYVWRSIMVSQNLIRSGCRRRIGNGRTTKGRWSHELVSQLFDPRDAELILQIPVSINFKDDWFWKGDIRGQYTVKDGYRCQGELSTTPDAVWNNIWKLRVPPKWRIFLWKALSNILPTITNLVRRRVEIPNICPACGDYEEDIMHILCTCIYARRVWNVSRLLIPNVDGYDFMQWVEAWLGSSAISAGFLKEQICGILYEIWRARNMAVWNSLLPTPSHLCHAFHGIWTAWSLINSPAATVVPDAPPEPAAPLDPAAPLVPPASLLPPVPEVSTSLPLGVVSCYADAGFHGTSPSFGFYVCSAQGGFLAAANGPLICPYDPLLAEAMAI